MRMRLGRPAGVPPSPSRLDPGADRALAGAGRDRPRGPGLLVLDGVLAANVQVGDRIATELLGPGDLVQPWNYDGRRASSARSAGGRSTRSALRSWTRAFAQAGRALAADHAGAAAPRRRRARRLNVQRAHRRAAPARGPAGAAAVAPGRSLGEGRARRGPAPAAAHPPAAGASDQRRATVGVARALSASRRPDS